MALYYPGCATSISDPQCSDCPTKELGDVRSVAFVKNTFSFTDITSTSEWTTGIEAGDIHVVPFTRGTVEVAENMTEGFGDLDETLDGFTFTLTYTDPNYKGMFPFYNTIKNSQRFYVVYRTESLIHKSAVEVVIVPKAPVAAGKKTAVRWEVVVKWSQDDLIEPQTMPSGVFDRCIDLS